MSGKGESSFAASGTSDDAENLDLYEATATYYDLWKDDRRGDVDFYLALAERTAGPVLKPMWKAFDSSSEPMVFVARKKRE